MVYCTVQWSENIYRLIIWEIVGLTGRRLVGRQEYNWRCLAKGARALIGIWSLDDPNPMRKWLVKNPQLTYIQLYSHKRISSQRLNKGALTLKQRSVNDRMLRLGKIRFWLAKGKLRHVYSDLKHVLTFMRILLDQLAYWFYINKGASIKSQTDVDNVDKGRRQINRCV